MATYGGWFTLTLGALTVKKSGVAGNPVCVPEMDDAVEGLANGNEPLYYRVR